MDILILINVLVLAVLLPLLALEFGVALIYLIAQKKYTVRMHDFIHASWEISGTFLVFFIVNLEATYPGLVMDIGTLYLTPILLAGAFLIFRNAFLAYREYAEDEAHEMRYSTIYSFATIIMVFLLISVLNSVVSGFGVNLSSMSASLFGIVVNIYNIAVFLSLAALSVLAALVMFQIKSIKLFVQLFVFSLAIFLFAMMEYVPYMFNAMGSNMATLILPAVLFVAMLALYVMQNKYAKFLVIPWIFTVILALQQFEYPYLFGGIINITNYLQPVQDEIYIILITIAGAILLLVGLGILFYAHRRSTTEAPDEPEVRAPEREHHVLDHKNQPPRERPQLPKISQ